jgi:hypothetical protein
MCQAQRGASIILCNKNLDLTESFENNRKLSLRIVPTLQHTNRSHAPAWERNNAAPAANNPRTWERSMPMMRTFDGWTLERPGVCSHAGAWERSTKNAPAFTQGTQERPGFRATPERCHDQIHPGRATRGRMPCAPTNMNRHHGESERQGDKKYMHYESFPRSSVGTEQCRSSGKQPANLGTIHADDADIRWVDAGASGGMFPRRSVGTIHKERSSVHPGDAGASRLPCNAGALSRSNPSRSGNPRAHAMRPYEYE